MVEIFLTTLGPALKATFRILYIMSPIWVTIILLLAWFNIWLGYKRREYIKAQGGMLLEIRLPREMTKSPVAMEVFLQYLSQTLVGNVLDVYLKGRVRAWFSLELVSTEGTVHFYIWLHPNYKNLVETQLYAQFPNIEVHEVPDYALGINHDPNKYRFGWIGHLSLTKKDVYPIKTYIDYGLDKDPDEEFKVDPLVPVLEFLGSLKKGEHVWMQILLQGHTKEGIEYGRITEKPDWKKGAKEEFQKIMDEAKYKPNEEKGFSPMQLSDTQRDLIKSMERNLAKTAFDTMIRVAYFAEKEAFNAGNIGGLLGGFKQFSSGDLNGFKPGFSSGFKYPWQDFNNSRRETKEKILLDAYKRRSYFNEPHKHLGGPPFILTTEEVATLFHFPGAVAGTPTLSRIPSKKAEAPSNLPI